MSRFTRVAAGPYGVADATKESEMLAVGTQAPGFTLSDQSGNDVSLSDFDGKWVVLWWYPKASTPG